MTSEKLSQSCCDNDFSTRLRPVFPPILVLALLSHPLLQQSDLIFISHTRFILQLVVTKPESGRRSNPLFPSSRYNLTAHVWCHVKQSRLFFPRPALRSCNFILTHPWKTFRATVHRESFFFISSPPFLPLARPQSGAGRWSVSVWVTVSQTRESRVWRTRPRMTSFLSLLWLEGLETMRPVKISKKSGDHPPQTES